MKSLLDQYEITDKFKSAMSDLGIRSQDIQLYTYDGFLECLRYCVSMRRQGEKVKGIGHIEMYLTDDYDSKYDELKYRLH